MVTGERKLVTVKEAERIYRNANGNVDMAVKELHQLPKREKAPGPPKGCISIREAARKYDIQDRTIGRWVNDGFIPVLMITKNTTYIDESEFSKIVNSYKSLPEGTRKSIKNAISVAE